MKIAPYSDLHLEFMDGPGQHQWTPVVFDSDKDETTMVLAGDLWYGTMSLGWIERYQLHTKFKNIVIVLGNHDYWNNDLSTLHEDFDIEVKKFDNVHFLHNATKIIDGVRFIGGPLWTDFDKGNPLYIMKWRHYMNDANFMKISGAKVMADDILHEHYATVDALKEVYAPFEGKTVVVTHHLPSWKFIDSQFREERNNWVNSYYAANCDSFVSDGIYDLWIYGHTHTPMGFVDYETNQRVICNPKGYSPMGERGFQHDMRIDL